MAERTYLTGYPDEQTGFQRRRTADELNQWGHWRGAHPEFRRRLLGLMDYCLDRGRDFGIGEIVRSVEQANRGFRESHFIVQSYAEAHHCVGGNGMFPDAFGVPRYWGFDPNGGHIHHAIGGPPPRSWHVQWDGNDAANGTEGDFCSATDTVFDYWSTLQFAASVSLQFGLAQIDPVNDATHFQMADSVFPRARNGWLWTPGFVVPIWTSPLLPLPKTEDDEMDLIQVNDGDAAQLTRSGLTCTHVKNQQVLADLIAEGILPNAPSRKVTRRSLSAFELVGEVVYPVGYTGPRTVPSDFMSHRS